MSVTDSRTPPRFVPTLTDVVEVQFATPAAEQVEVRSEVIRRPVPELPGGGEEPRYEAAKPTSLEPLVTAQDMTAIAENLQEKVMARLDESLEERMRYALADMVQLHTQALYQAIRLEVEQLVSASVHEAVAQELAHMRKSSR